jgi:hypothetical protein
LGLEEVPEPGPDLGLVGSGLMVAVDDAEPGPLGGQQCPGQRGPERRKLPDLVGIEIRAGCTS